MSSQAPGADRRVRLARARLYLVLDAAPAGRSAEALLREALAGGVDMVQLRDKEADDEALLRAAATFRRVCDEHDALFWLNDRPDLAVAAGADGVHVGQHDAPVREVRDQVGPEILIGLSTHSPEQFDAGLASGADELSVGPVYETPTKPGRSAAGIDSVRHAATRGSSTPWFAIGGIAPRTIHDVLEAGAERVVVVRAIRDAPAPRAAAAELRAALDRRPVGAAQ
jgi:thiamine-phosphate pyrophosphorylase